MSFIKNIEPFKKIDLTGFIPVLIHGQEIGHTKTEFAKIISDFNQTWQLTHAGLELSSSFETFDDRTEAVDQTFVALSQSGHLPAMPDYSGFGGVDWYPVRYRQNAVPLFKVKRFYATYIGIQSNPANKYNVVKILLDRFVSSAFCFFLIGKAVTGYSGLMAGFLVTAVLQHFCGKQAWAWITAYAGPGESQKEEKE